MIWRIKFDVAGGHVHCALFCGKQANRTFAKCGDFVVRRGEEFASLMRAFSGADFFGEGPNGIMSACNDDSEVRP